MTVLSPLQSNLPSRKLHLEFLFPTLTDGLFQVHPKEVLLQSDSGYSRNMQEVHVVKWQQLSISCLEVLNRFTWLILKGIIERRNQSRTGEPN